MYELHSSLDQLHFTFDKKEKQWKIGYLLEFHHGSLKDVSLLGIVRVHINETGELVNIKADDDLDFPEEFVRCAKINKRVQERIRSSQYIIKELNRLKGLKTLGNVTDFTFDYKYGYGSLSFEYTNLCFNFGWEKTHGFRFLSVKYSIDNLKEMYSGSSLNVIKENALEQDKIDEIQNKIKKRTRVRSLFNVWSP